jgi:large subunit ribosomal protein L7/L12
MTPGAALWSGREDHHCSTAAASVECRLSKGENGMATKAEKLEALAKKQAQIQKQIQVLKARDTAQERKDDTRRKVLIGGFVLAQMKKNGIGVQLMTYESVRFMDTLNNDRDRVLFGLAAKPALSPAGEAEGAVLDGSK